MIEFEIYNKKFKAYQFLSDFNSFKEIWNAIHYRMESIANHHKNFKNQNVLSYDDGRYDFDSDQIFKLWSSKNNDTPEKAWLYLCDLNDSNRWCKCRDINRRFTYILPFMYEILPHGKINFSGVEYQDYLLIDLNDLNGGFYNVQDRFVKNVLKKEENDDNT